LQVNRYNDTFELFKKLIENILANPENPNFKKINTSNARLKATVFATEDSRNVLKSIGFVTTDQNEYQNTLNQAHLKVISGDLNLANSEVQKFKK
jgi:hypothetical protein